MLPLICRNVVLNEIVRILIKEVHFIWNNHYLNVPYTTDISIMLILSVYLIQNLNNI